MLVSYMSFTRLLRALYITDLLADTHYGTIGLIFMLINQNIMFFTNTTTKNITNIIMNPIHAQGIVKSA